MDLKSQLFKLHSEKTPTLFKMSTQRVAELIFLLCEVLYFGASRQETAHCCVSRGCAINGRAHPFKPLFPLISSLGCHAQCVKVWSRLKLV